MELPLRHDKILGCTGNLSSADHGISGDPCVGSPPWSCGKDQSLPLGRCAKCPLPHTDTPDDIRVEIVWAINIIKNRSTFEEWESPLSASLNTICSLTLKTRAEVTELSPLRHLADFGGMIPCNGGIKTHQWHILLTMAVLLNTGSRQ